MPRVNIYLPAGLWGELSRYRDAINLSEVCANALRAELSSRMTDRTASAFFRPRSIHDSGLDVTTEARYRLRRVVVAAANSETEDSTEAVTHAAVAFLDRTLGEGLQLGIGGGTQMWSIIRRLAPRNLGVALSAIGVGQVDHAAPHVHPNTLVTLLSLLYAPRSTTKLVGAPDFRASWSLDAGDTNDICRVIIGSCAPFRSGSAYAQLLGRETAEFLVEERALGDFLGVFLTPDGRSLEPYLPSSIVSHIGSADLREQARRSDTIVALVAAGENKHDLIRRVLSAELCNTLITDERTARALLRFTKRPVDSE